MTRHGWTVGVGTRQGENLWPTATPLEKEEDSSLEIKSRGQRSRSRSGLRLELASYVKRSVWLQSSTDDSLFSGAKLMRRCHDFNILSSSAYISVLPPGVSAEIILTTALVVREICWMAQNDHDIEGCKMEGQRAPIQQAQCRFPGLAVSNAKY